MNTELEIKFIQLLKLGLLDGLNFTESRCGTITGFHFEHIDGQKFIEDYKFREEGNRIVVSKQFCLPPWGWGRLAYFKRDFLKVDNIYNIIRCDDFQYSVEFCLNLEKLMVHNIQEYLLSLDDEIWKNSSPLIIDEHNYIDYDLSNLVVFRLDSTRINAMDNNGKAYEWTICNKDLDKHLSKFLGHAYSRGLHYRSRGDELWPDLWHTFKHSNGHCLFLKEEYCHCIPIDVCKNYRTPKVYCEMLEMIVDSIIRGSGS